MKTPDNIAEVVTNLNKHSC